MPFAKPDRNPALNDLSVSDETKDALAQLDVALRTGEDDQDGRIKYGQEDGANKGTLSGLESWILSLAVDALFRAAARNEGHTDTEREEAAITFDQAAQSLENVT